MADLALKALETIAEERTPGERRLACAMAADEAGEGALATFIRASAHLVEHTNREALARELLWPPSSWAASARAWLERGPLHLRPRWRSRQRLGPGAFLGQMSAGDGSIGGMAFSADGHPAARIGRSLLEDGVCTAFGEEARQWAPDGTPRGLGGRGVEWLHAAEQSWSGDVLRVSTRYRKAHLSGYAGARIRAADVAREAPRAAVAIGYEVVLHDAESGAVLETWALDEPVVALAFLGRELVAVDAQGHVLAWELGP